MVKTLISLEKAIELLSNQLYGHYTINEEHNEALAMALEILIKVKTGRVVVKFEKEQEGT